MPFNIGETVVKPGLGICKIKAIRKMQVEGKDQQFYVLHSGDVDVMVPFNAAHTGGLRNLINDEERERIYEYLREPIPIPQDEQEHAANYSVDLSSAKSELRMRNPMAMADLIKKLFYKQKIADLSHEEKDVYKNAMSILADEIAAHEHTTRQKISASIRTKLVEGRKSRKSSLYT